MNNCFFFDEEHRLSCIPTAPVSHFFSGKTIAEGIFALLENRDDEKWEAPADLLFLRRIIAEYLQNCLRNDQFALIPDDAVLADLCNIAPPDNYSMYFCHSAGTATDLRVCLS